MNTKDDLKIQQQARIAELRERRADLRKRYVEITSEMREIEGELGNIGVELLDLVAPPQEHHEGRRK